jgi:hypothetical protein
MASTPGTLLAEQNSEETMAVFYSFHYDRDSWRVQQVVNMGALEGQPILNSQEWESIRRRGEDAIKDWISKQMSYKSAVVVLVGAQTDTRSWVQYEITKAWNDKRPLVGIRVNGLADSNGRTDYPGGNPFAKVSLQSGHTLADYVPLYEPAGSSSSAVYASIKNNIVNWGVECLQAWMIARTTVRSVRSSLEPTPT